MRLILTLSLVILCFSACQHEIAMLKNPKSAYEHAIKIDALVLTAPKDDWDKSLVGLTGLAAIGGVGAAISAARAAMAAQATIKEIRKQVSLQRLDALVKLGNYYQDSYGRGVKNMEEIFLHRAHAPKVLDSGFDRLIEKYFGEEKEQEVIKKMMTLQEKSDAIDREIEKYYDDLVDADSALKG